MFAVRMHEYGGPEVLRYEEAPDPAPGPGQAVIRVEACAVGHFDLDLREGVSRIPLQLPHILGSEAVGRVQALPAEVNGCAVGQLVLIPEEEACRRCEFCRCGQENLCIEPKMLGVARPGCYAELVTARAEDLIPLSESIAATEWAAVQVAFGTAWHMLVTRAGLRPGETVLVNAAGSGVGSGAIQIAKLAGAYVLANAGTDAKLLRAREYGADETVNYSTDSVYEFVMGATGGRGVDVVFDHVGGNLLVESIRSLRKGGRLVTCGAHAGETVPLDVIELFRAERRIIGARTCTRRELDQVLSLVEQAKLRPVVDRVLPLERADDAHRRMAERAHFGKIVLVPSPS